MSKVKMALVDFPLFLIGIGYKGASRFILAEEAQSDFAYFRQTQLGQFISKWLFASPSEPLQIELQLDDGAVISIELQLKDDSEEVFTAIMIAGISIGLYLGWQATKDVEDFVELWKSGKLKQNRFMYRTLFKDARKSLPKNVVMAPIALYNTKPKVELRKEINISERTLDGTKIKITQELIVDAEMEFALGNRWKLAKRILKLLGKADLLFFFATWMVDLVFLSDEEEDVTLGYLDSLADSVGWDEEVYGPFTDYYGISLPTSPSDIFVSVLLRELFDAVAGESLPEGLPLEVFLLSALGTFTDFFEVKIEVILPLILDVEPPQFNGFFTLTGWVEGHIYELFELFLLPWVFYCVYSVARQASSASV